MQCGDPILVWNLNNRKHYRNWSMADDQHRYNAQQVFDCGKCLYCRRKRSQQLAMRCVLHASCYDRNSFLTLTYDESKPGHHNKLCYRDIQLFKKKLRKHFAPEKIELFNVHEYGKNGKKHWHLIAFNVGFSDKEIHTHENQFPIYKSEILTQKWGHGFASIGDVSMASALYQAQYTQKDFKNGNSHNAKKSKTNHSGIGRTYFFRNYTQILTAGTIAFQGKDVPLPRYFEKLAHKHWAHFNEPILFHDIPGRRRIYNPFTKELPNLRISELFQQYEKIRKEKNQKKENKWKRLISLYKDTKKDPGFMQSLKNAVYDLQNKTQKEQF